MIPFAQHPEFYNQPIRLDTGDNPAEVIRDFFDTYPLHETRRLLWQMVETSLALPDSVFDDAGERRSLLWLYDRLETVLEAALLLSQDSVSFMQRAQR